MIFHSQGLRPWSGPGLVCEHRPGPLSVCRHHLTYGCHGLLWAHNVSPCHSGSLRVKRVGVDHESNVPPYRQVAAILRARIESGELAPRQRLPSIAGLVQEYGIARTTAAQALKVLIDEGLAEVVPGWGTYVTSPGD